MRVLLTTDVHGDYETLAEMVETGTYDGILSAGDLGDAGTYSDYESNLDDVLEAYQSAGTIAKAVPGNMDMEKSSVKALRERRMNLHRKTASFESFAAVGFGGGLTPFGTPFEPDETEIADSVSQLIKTLESDTVVAVVHQPPFDSVADLADGDHVGSKQLRRVIEESPIDLYLTGHIHESRGIGDIGDCTVVNPGPVKDGFYAVAEIDDGVEDVELKSL